MSTLTGLTHEQYDRLMEAVQPAGAVSVPDALARVRKTALEVCPEFDPYELDLFVAAFASSPERVTAFLGMGAESVALRRTQGDVLKITALPLMPEHGRREIDAPLRDWQRHPYERDGRDHAVYSYVQPELKIVGTWSDFALCRDQFEAAGYRLSDIKFSNVGLDPATGRYLLCDYWGAERI